jgi:hypothetical protein
VQPSAPGQGSRAERTVPGEQIKAVEVHILQLDAGTDLMVEERQLGAHSTK